MITPGKGWNLRLVYQHPRKDAPTPLEAQVVKDAVKIMGGLFPQAQPTAAQTARPGAAPQAAPVLTQAVSSKTLLNQVIDRLPPAALGDIKNLMLQAVDLMDNLTIERAAAQFASSYGVLGAIGASMTTIDQKKGVIRNMINGSRTKEDIKRLITYIDDASFDQALQRAMSDPNAVNRFVANPNNTEIAKRMAGTILNSIPSLARRQAMEQIIMDATPQEFGLIKYMIKMQIDRADSKVLDRVTEKPRKEVLRREYGDVGAWFANAAYDVGFVSSATIKSRAKSHIDRLDKGGLLPLIHSMEPEAVSAMIALSVNSWGAYDTAQMASTPANQSVAGSLALKSTRIVMRAR